MKVIVSGGRNFSDRRRLIEVLDSLRPIDLIIQGGASGADLMAREYAEARNIEVQTFHANWNEHGKSAGPRRNRSMCEKNKDATAVFFEGGAGTKNCLMNALDLGLRVIDVRHKYLDELI